MHRVGIKNTERIRAYCSQCDFSETLCQVQSLLLHCHSLKSIQDSLSLSFPPFLRGVIRLLVSAIAAGDIWGLSELLTYWLDCALYQRMCVWVWVGDRWTETDIRIHFLIWRAGEKGNASLSVRSPMYFTLKLLYSSVSCLNKRTKFIEVIWGLVKSNTLSLFKRFC